MKKYLLISVFCVCAALSATAEEQNVVPIDEVNQVQTDQWMGQNCASAEEMNDSNDETSGQQSFNKLPNTFHLQDGQMEVMTRIGDVVEGTSYVPRPIRPTRPPRIIDGEFEESAALSDLINSLIDAKGRGHDSYSLSLSSLWNPVFETTAGGYVKKPIKPGSGGSTNGSSGIEDLIKPFIYGGGSPLPRVSTSHGSKPAGDVNNDGVLNLDDVTSMVDSMLSNQNPDGIGNLTGLIDQLLGE